MVTRFYGQGSVLGPLFYILYANDIVNIIQHCNIALYADDTVLYTANPKFEKSVQFMNTDVNALTKWCEKNGIRMNTDKTKTMIFGTPRKLKELPEVNISVDGVALKNVTSYKYLGLTLDSQLRYTKHVNKVISGVSLKLKHFRRMRSFLNTKAAVMVYKNMLLPIIEYGDIFMTGSSAETKRKFQVLQNKGLRCALNTDKYSCADELHEEVGLLKLKFRREEHMLSYMYDLSKDTSKLSCPKKYAIATRSSKKKLFKIKRPRTEKFKKSLAYMGPKKWNKLPEDLQHTVSKVEFKARVHERINRRSLRLSGLLSVHR